MTGAPVPTASVCGDDDTALGGVIEGALRSCAFAAGAANTGSISAITAIRYFICRCFICIVNSRSGFAALTINGSCKLRFRKIQVSVRYNGVAKDKAARAEPAIMGARRFDKGDLT